ncbi:hypothetical protein D8674_011317 [Pyrus ussuriensis x Pyrus communis]|uniref:Integrase catalytic domain-containing protein n=1 Tax=Pyrus ussuriensis x Pyrus communis TaxID=2448454 RepID=A0A5N5FYC3_9ROSA|nr:hypothetical protein D8674_011317 [Pyrus ussuriensis x Pyrus communis]
MPRATTTSRISVMDGRVAELENSMASLKASVDASMDALPSLIDNAVAATLDTKLQIYFEQFRRELHFRPSSSGHPVHLVPDCSDPRASAPDLRPPSPNRFGGDHPPRPPWTQRIDCFLGGLKKELKFDVKLLKPATVHDAIAIAVQLDAKFTEFKSTQGKPSPMLKYPLVSAPTPIPVPPRPGNLPVKRLSLEEVQRKRERGECWFCSDKWTRGHKCGLKQLLMLDLLDGGDECMTEELPETPELYHMALSACAFYGTTASPPLQTMKVEGLLRGHFVKILLDSGRCDAVLGVQWLSSVSPVLWDFQLLTMEFSKGAQKFKLFHSPSTVPFIQELPLHNVDKELNSSNLGLCLYSLDTTPLGSSNLSSSQLQELQALLGEFEAIFELPTKLPPSRSLDHSIPLVPGAKPPNLRPYHYGPLQKTEIEKAVQELLEAGFIRASHSPFSFPVLTSWQHHLVHLKEVLTVLHQNHLYLKKSKCSFGQSSVEYLGHIVSQDGVAADPSKLKAIQQWPQPRNVKELRGFLGLTEGFAWNESASEAFRQLKSIMSSPQVLALPDFSQTFVVECDASGNGIGAVLQQNHRPIAFFSQALGPRNQALSTYERELIAIVHAIRKWQNYLQGRHFVIKTDHSSLKYFLGQRTNTQFQQKWVAKLLGFDYEIQYRSGKENTVADSLSRIPNHQELWKIKLMEEHHCTPAAGHQGVAKTYQRIKKGMDFIVGLPNCKGKSVIMVIVDRLSKYSHFIALAHPYNASIVAQLFIEHVFRLHGMPNSIVSDRDPVFVNAFWKELFRLQGSKLCMSSGYHPQSDGQTEVMNRCLETYLRCFVGGQPRKWVQWLPWAEWCFNTAYHTSSKYTPFEVVYGFSPPYIVPHEVGSTKVASVEQCMIERDGLLAVLKTNLQLAQNRMKVQADKKRIERHFNVGDMVYLKLVPYQLHSLVNHSYHKLQPRFYGPYAVIEKIGAVAYKLKLPEGSKIHPVFHVSCLKKQDLPATILSRRMYKKGSVAGVQLLVQWQGKEAADATWEDFDEFQKRFPDFVV